MTVDTFQHRIYKGVAVCFFILKTFGCQGQEKNGFSPIGYAQQKNLPVSVMSAHEDGALKFFHQIDSVADAGEIPSYFARLYCISMKNIELKLKDADSSTTEFIRRFELNFIEYFLSACYGYRDGNLSPTSPWNCYFSHPNARPLQLMFM